MSDFFDQAVECYQRTGIPLTGQLMNKGGKRFVPDHPYVLCLYTVNNFMLVEEDPKKGEEVDALIVPSQLNDGVNNYPHGIHTERSIVGYIGGERFRRE